MSCDVGEATEGLENELCCHFTYVTTHSPTLLSLYLHHSSFSNPSIASPTSQLILQPFFCFSYVTGSSLKSPGELPMVLSVRLLIMYSKKINSPHPPFWYGNIWYHTTCFHPLFHCVLFSNSCPPSRRLQCPTAQNQCHRSSSRSVYMTIWKHFIWEVGEVLRCGLFSIPALAYLQDSGSALNCGGSGNSMIKMK